MVLGLGPNALIVSNPASAGLMKTSYYAIYLLRRLTRSDLCNLSLGARHHDHPAYSKKPCDATWTLGP
jgi:hypothetical protein